MLLPAVGSFLGVLVGYGLIVVYSEIKLVWRKRYLKRLISEALDKPAPIRVALVEKRPDGTN